MIRSRGEVDETGKEEPGGVGGVEVVQEERWEEMRRTLCPGGVTFFKTIPEILIASDCCFFRIFVFLLSSLVLADISLSLSSLRLK